MQFTGTKSTLIDFVYAAKLYTFASAGSTMLQFKTYIVLPRYYDHVYIFMFVNIDIKTLELFTCNGWLHTLRL